MAASKLISESTPGIAMWLYVVHQPLSMLTKHIKYTEYYSNFDHLMHNIDIYIYNIWPI